MSLILDALRRADAERGRGAVPGLHTPQAAAVVVDAPERRPRWPLVGAALVGGMAVAGGVAWWIGGAAPAAVVTLATPAAVPAAAAAPAAAPAAVVITAASPVPAASIPQAESGAASAAAAAPGQPSRPASATTPATAPAADATPAAVDAPRIEPLPLRPVAPVVKPIVPVAPLASAATPSPSGAKPSVPGPAPAEPAAKVPLLQELSPAVRQQLPALAVSGASYSADPSYRMVIVNGQVLREGETAAPGVVLESIAARQVVLRGHGQRWAVPY